MKTNYHYLVLIFLFTLACNKENETILEHPVVLTNEVQKISLNSAVVKGELSILGDYNIHDHGFVVSKNLEPTISNSKIALGSIDSLRNFQTVIENLDQNTEYFVRAYLEYGLEEVLYGNTLTFNTLEPNVWVEKMKYSGGYLTGALSFVIDDKLFVGTGINDDFVNYFYEYNYEENTWAAIADLPSKQRAHGISFAVGGYGYVGLGYNCIGSGICTHYYYNDLWRYSHQNDNWLKMSDFPGTPRAFSTCFVIGNNAYVTGGSSFGDNDLWEYNTLTDTWTRKADYPGGCSSRGISFSVNNKGFVGFGWTDGTCNDFWEYDPINDIWTEKENFPGEARYGAIGLSILDKGYLACGINQDYSKKYLTDIWEYTQETDTWTQIDTNYPGKGRLNMIADVIDDKIFIGLGTNSILGGPANRFDDIWQYIPDLK